MNMKNIIATALVTLSLAAACTPTVNVRGSMIEDHKLAQVKAGVDNRTDVLRKMGSPTTIAPFDDTVWYYLHQTTEKRGIFDDQVVDERIVVVMFDQDGVVQQVKDVDSKRQDIPYVERETATSGNELTFMQQMLGNLGKFNKNEKPTGGVGAPTTN